MTTTEITSLARAKLLEQGTELLSDSTIMLYANLAYKDVIKQAFPNNSINTSIITFTEGVGALPSDFGTLYTDAVDENLNVYPEVSIADFVRLDSQNGVVIEDGTIKVSPDTVTSLTIKYYPTYETLTAVNSPTIDEFLHEPIVYGILARAFEDLQDPELATFYSNKFTLMLKEKLSNLSNYEEDAQKGGVMFNGINILGGGGNSFF